MCSANDAKGRTKGRMYTTARLAGLVMLVLAFRPVDPADRLVWKTDLEDEVRFARMLGENLLLVGTERHLFALDAKTGSQVWRFRSLRVESEDVLFLPDFDVLLVSEGWGGEFQDKRGAVLAIDSKTGKALWESPTIKEGLLAVVPDLERNRVLMVTANKPHGKDRGDFERKLRLYLLDTATGKIVWRSDFDDEIRLTPITPVESQKDRKYYNFNLAAYHFPVFKDGKLFVSYDGIRCYEVETGRPLWRKKFDVFEGDLARSYAEPVFDKQNIYVAGEGKVRAFRLGDGKQIWTTDDYGVVTDLYSDADRIYAKLGGLFYDFADDEWDQKGPFGVVVLNRSNGKKIWKWHNGDDGITNLLVFGDRIYLADSDDLIALDRSTGKRLYKISHKFDKTPRFIGLNESEQLTLTGDENAAGFHHTDGKRVWSHHLEAPGIGFWKRMAAGFLATTGSAMVVASYGLLIQQGLFPAVPSQVDYIIDRQGLLSRLGRATGKGIVGASGNLLQQTRYAHLDGNHQYFFTKLPQGGKGLLGVNLSNGAVDHSLPLKENNVEVVVSESNRKAFQRDGSQVIAYDLQHRAPPVLK